MAKETVTLEFQEQLLQRTLDETRTLRKDVADVRSLCLQTYDFSRRLDRRMVELKDDLEVMMKAELMGSRTHMEA